MTNIRLTVIMFIIAAALAPLLLVRLGAPSPGKHPAAGAPVIEPDQFRPAGLKRAPWEGQGEDPAKKRPAATPAPADSAQEQPAASRRGFAVIELFTSQGCSSCPPADAVFSELAAAHDKSTDVILLGFHVDYWDHLGWKDPFASRAFTERQRAYGAALKSDSVYTPQMVVNGRVGFVGSDRTRAIMEMEKALGQPAGAALDVRTASPIKAGAELRVHGRVTPAGKSLPAGLRVLAALVEDGLETDVKSGENAGRRLRHNRVVRAMTVGEVGAEGAIASTLAVPAGVRPERCRVAVVVETTGDDRSIIAGAYAPAPASADPAQPVK